MIWRNWARRFPGDGTSVTIKDKNMEKLFVKAIEVQKEKCGKRRWVAIIGGPVERPDIQEYPMRVSRGVADRLRENIEIRKRRELRHSFLAEMGNSTYKENVRRFGIGLEMRLPGKYERKYVYIDCDASNNEDKVREEFKSKVNAMLISEYADKFTDSPIIFTVYKLAEVLGLKDRYHRKDLGPSYYAELADEDSLFALHTENGKIGYPDECKIMGVEEAVIARSKKKKVRVFKTGRYEGWPIRDVICMNVKYVRWCLANLDDFELDDKERNCFINSASSFLKRTNGGRVLKDYDWLCAELDKLIEPVEYEPVEHNPE